MQPITIVTIALTMMLAGAAVLFYQRSAQRRFEVLLIVLGVALVAGGFAVLRDGLEGSHRIIWMLPGLKSAAGPVAHAETLSSVRPP